MCIQSGAVYDVSKSIYDDMVKKIRPMMDVRSIANLLEAPMNQGGGKVKITTTLRL